ncbi:hypothetical protein [Leucobacter aridicollis]|uniref:hypothetical protein n=1 Tax=Leucobacter aridicollis TaxID=283878 RepID=UPI002168366F|nr:hypothetical protein [Leucobacter aridicollis]MCS3428649.1 hypothetical protein [Leucobacter aridicollis]
MSRAAPARSFGGMVAAELAKIRTLPAAIVSAAASVVVGAAVAGALAWGGAGTALAPAAAVASAIPLAQVCLIAFAVLPMTHENDGSQLRTSLTAVPSRAHFAIAKSVASLLAVSAIAAMTVAASFGAAFAGWTLSGHGAVGGGASPDQDPGAAFFPLAGAAAYLALIGMLAHAISLLARRIAPALGAALVLVLIAPPLFGGSELARWLPSRAGELLYTGATDPVLSAGLGAAVLAGWTAVVGAAGFVAMRVRDA